MTDHTVTVTVRTLGVGQEGGNIPSHLGELIGVLAEALGNIPAEYRDSAEVDCSPSQENDYAYERMVISYDRLQTEEERAARETEDREWLERRLRHAEEHLAKLKAQAREVA